MGEILGQFGQLLPGVGQIFTSGQHIPPLARQVIPALGLFLVDLRQLLPEDLIGQAGLDLLQAFLAEVWIRADGIGHHVDVRVMALVVESGVPPQIRRRDTHGLGNGPRLGTHQLPPGLCGFKSCISCVLPAQGDDVGPYIAVMVCNLIGSFIQIQRFIRRAPKAMSALPFGTGPGGKILDVALTGADFEKIVLCASGDKFAGGSHAGFFQIVLIFQAALAVWEVLQKLVDHALLLFGGRQIGPAADLLVRTPGRIFPIEFNALPGGNVTDVICQMRGDARRGR